MPQSIQVKGMGLPGDKWGFPPPAQGLPTTAQSHHNCTIKSQVFNLREEV